ncbi:MAG: glycosyltransferase family 4 protein [candidate division WOR-3 bacterium]
MKVCYISAYPPMSDSNGYYTKRLERYLKEMGVEVILILPCPFKLKTKIPHTYLGILNFMDSVRFLKKHTPDLIHIQHNIHTYISTAFHFWLIIGLVSRILKIPVIVTAHEALTAIKRYGLIAKFYYRLMSLLSKMILVHSENSRKELIRQCNIKPSKIFHMPHGFHEVEKNLSYVDFLKNNWGIKGKKIILFFGLVRPDKGIENLIKAMALIKDKYKKDNAIALIVGDVRKREGLINRLFQKKDERYYQYLEQLTREYNLNDMVIFKKMFVPDEQVFSIFALGDVVVLPYNRAEDSGVLNIALSVPRPVVISNVGGIAETLENTGVLVPPKSPESIADAIVKILDDNGFRKKLLDDYANLYNRLNPKTIAEYHYYFYKNCIMN